jgi:DNA-3-methyladenine glycosylase I
VVDDHSNDRTARPLAPKAPQVTRRRCQIGAAATRSTSRPPTDCPPPVDVAKLTPRGARCVAPESQRRPEWRRTVPPVPQPQPHLIRGSDGRRRCWWGASSPEYQRYHDDEWGRPVTDDRGIYERLTLEAFQSGLSWLTILRKRDNFRAAFANFEIDAVACFGARDVKRLMADAGIVRNRAKIEAAIANARAATALGGSLAELVWSYAPDRHRRAIRAREEMPATTLESTALAKELKRRGFRFLGPTTVYATMQACGIVNDHLVGCHVRGEVEGELAGAKGTVLARQTR